MYTEIEILQQIHQLLFVWFLITGLAAGFAVGYGVTKK